MVLKIPYVLIEPYVFLYVAGNALYQIVLPQFLLDNICQRTFNGTICSNINSPLFKKEQDIVQKESALWLTGILPSEAGLSILATLLIGPLADTIGCRNAMFLTPTCTGIRYLILILLTSLNQSFHPALILLPVPFAAACGLNPGTTVMASSYTAKVVAIKDRTFRLALVSAGFSFAISLFGFVSGFLLNSVGYRGAFVMCLGTSILDALFLAFFVSDEQRPAQPASGSEITLPPGAKQICKDETTSPNQISPKNHDTEKSIEIKEGNEKVVSGKGNDRPIIIKSNDEKELQQHLSVMEKFKIALAKSNPLTNCRELYGHVRERKQRKTVASLIFAAFSSVLGWMGEFYVCVLFIKGRPLNFSAVDVGYFLAFQGINWGVTGYVIINSCVQYCFHCNDFLVITVSLLAHAVYLILVGFSTTKIMIYIVQLMSALAALDIPTIRSALTKIVGPDKYATILAVSGTFQSLGIFVASFTATAIYAEFLTIHRGAVFFFLALILLVSVIITGRLFWKERSENRKNRCRKENNVEIPLDFIKGDTKL